MPLTRSQAGKLDRASTPDHSHVPMDGHEVTVSTVPLETDTASNNVQSSIPGMSIAQIRAVLGEQRKQFQEQGYVDMIDEVFDGMTRIEFDYKYVFGIAQKRHAKHKRASTKNKQKLQRSVHS